MKLRFLADADLNKAIVTGLVRREPSVVFFDGAAFGFARLARICGACFGCATRPGIGMERPRGLAPSVGGGLESRLCAGLERRRSPRSDFVMRRGVTLRWPAMTVRLTRSYFLVDGP